MPWGLFGLCVALAAASARFASFKLLRMRKESGISRMSSALRFHQQCISVTSEIREIRLRAPGTLTSDSTAAAKLHEVPVSPGAPWLACPAEAMDEPGGACSPVTN